MNDFEETWDGFSKEPSERLNEIEQMIVTWRSYDGAYYNAWRSGSCDSIDSYLRDGWFIRKIKDEPNDHLWILFERKKRHAKDRLINYLKEEAEKCDTEKNPF